MTATPRQMLPALSADEARHSARLQELIAAEIAAAGGWISFERFMELALYAPGLGYYSAGSHKLGAGGDFVTAPEISALFGQCLARAVAPVLHASGGEILELGAGTGRLAATLLSGLAALGVLPRRYAILEVSADLAERQRAHLARLAPELAARVEWLTRLPAAPFRGVMLANEVADALPCRRFEIRAGAVHELGVSFEAGRFVSTARAADAALERDAAQVLAGFDLPDGYVSEACLHAGPWVAGLAAALGAGALLIFDYGLPRRHFYHPQRHTGTLRCHFRQRAHDDPFVHIGLQDITAWVDFTRLALAGDAAGLTLEGFTTQAGFLIENGIEAHVAAAADEPTRVRLAGEARRLVMPEEMGEAFKVLALSRALPEGLVPGFSVHDLRHLL